MKMKKCKERGKKPRLLKAHHTKYSLLKKGLSFLTILLFVGLCIIPSNAVEIKTSGNTTDCPVNVDNYTNYLGKIYFNLSRFSVDIGFEHPEDTDYTFPVVDDNYISNFTVELNITSEQKLFFTRGVFTSAKILVGDTPLWMAFGINFMRGDYVVPWTIKDIERNFNSAPINGQENVTLTIILRARGFPFSFLNPKETSFTVTAHFLE